MQKCPKCGRTYESDTQKFCTHDGGRLAPEEATPANQAPTTYDLNQTVRTDPFDPEATVPRMSDLGKTVASLPTSEILRKETGPAIPPPSAQPPQQPPPPTPEARAQQPTVAFNQPPPVPQPPMQQPYYPQPPGQQPQQGPPQQQQHAQQQPSPHQMPPQQMQQPPQQYAPAPPQQQQHGGKAPSAQKKKSSLAPLIIGLVVLVLVGGAAAWYFLIYKKGANANTNTATANTNANANANTNTNAGANVNENSNTTANGNTETTPPPPPPPANATEFVNSKDNLDGKLAEKYSDFSFYYPNDWERDPKSGVPGASNFIRVERKLPPDRTQENFTVSWYDSKGTLEADEATVFPKLIESLKAKLSQTYQDMEVLKEGPITINSLNGYEFRFQSVEHGTKSGDVTHWGWIVYLPPGKEGETNGLQLLMLSTSLAPELKSAEDVGVKGELPVILNSFRMGKD